ncbi:AhpD family alkylhydroperoxidase [Alkalihalobacillus xiaoxiensis]|uniref:AhpD family alkylhydroperoxidase n=1 Tax=Shouchella xiaoxiensis TaxID=766895 RepID=A0ABS2SZ43_9BACI|nr:carboxymuconolactone decarboxylase family protein [Shouchella xiaoxiensis]MBM7840530.1 AhpD family alkylhydroperoxidase [Shouchella xiaoxiensis]
MNREGHTSTEHHMMQYKKGVGSFEEKMPIFAEKYNEFTEQCFNEGALSKKHKHLIALGMSIHAQDEYCIIYHTKGCLDNGCSEEELLETVSVATAFGSGAALSQGATLVQEAFRELGNDLQ